MSRAAYTIGAPLLPNPTAMLRDDAQRALRHLCHVWKAEMFANTDAGELHFAEFARWVRDRQPDLLSFRSKAGAEYDAEQWFDEEFRQTWRR